MTRPFRPRKRFPRRPTGGWIKPTPSAPSTTFNDYDLEDWHAYEQVRKAGHWNMFDPQARAATGLSSERYAFVMKHYSELRDAVQREMQT